MLIGPWLDDLQKHGRIPLVLDGWQRFSVWGWDSREDTLFAQLWMNTDDSDSEPRHRITPGSYPVIRYLDDLAQFIAQATGCSDLDARQAMAYRAPQSVKLALS